MNDAYNVVMDKVQKWLHTLLMMLPNILVAVIIFVAFYLLGRILKKITGKLLGKVSRHMGINELIAKIVMIAAIGVGFFLGLGIMELDKAVTSLLAGVGILGLALGFAFQDIAANFMSGIALAIKEPFKPNDIIESNDHFGKVLKINLRTTDIVTPEGQLVLIPNKEVFQNPIINYSYRGSRRVDLNVGVSYGEDLEFVKRTAIAAVKNIPGQMEGKEVELFYEEFGDSSINFVIRVWINFRKQRDFTAARSDMIMKIKKAFDENGIMIPFPIRTLDFGIKGGEKLNEMLSNPNNPE